jgi:hypothetical protein
VNFKPDPAIAGGAGAAGAEDAAAEDEDALGGVAGEVDEADRAVCGLASPLKANTANKS